MDGDPREPSTDDVGERLDMVGEFLSPQLVSSWGGLGEERTERKSEGEMDSDDDAVEARSGSTRLTVCLRESDPPSSFPAAAPPGKNGVEEGFRPGLLIIV